MIGTNRALLACLLLLGAFGGCNGNIDDTRLLIAVTERVSLDSSGNESFGNSSNPSISADGRYVAFDSIAVTLVPGDTNASSDVFRKDTVLGTMVRVSVEAAGTGAFPNGPDGAADGENANGTSIRPSISADGRFVAFQSDATDLITDTPKPAGQFDIYVRDLQLNTTALVSVPTAGTFANGPSANPAVSPDGRFVAFESVATNLSADVVSGAQNHVFVWDRNSNTCELVSKHTSGAVGNGVHQLPAVSQVGSNGANGVFVVFQSTSGNLVTGAGAAGIFHVFRKAIPAGAAEMADAVNVGLVPSDGPSQTPAITPDGRFVVFRSAGTNLAANDINGADDIFLRDFSIAPPGLLTLVSTSVSGVPGSAGSSLPAISADGRYVAFLSLAQNLVPSDANIGQDAFWKDLQSNAPESIRIVNVSTFGHQGIGIGSVRPSITADGRRVAFVYGFADLVNGDTNGSNDILTNGPLH